MSWHESKPLIVYFAFVCLFVFWPPGFIIKAEHERRARLESALPNLAAATSSRLQLRLGSEESRRPSEECLRSDEAQTFTLAKYWLELYGNCAPL